MHAVLFSLLTVFLSLSLFHVWVVHLLVCLQCAKEHGAQVVDEPWEETDKNGTVRMARVQTYGDTTHTLIDRSKYKGPFLPGYKPAPYSDPLAKLL